MRTPALLTAAALLLGACTMGEHDRRELLQSAQRIDEQVAADTALRGLRSPQDSARVIYGPIESLERPDTSRPNADTTRANGAAPGSPPAGRSQ